jgi:hypothetical protein
LSFFFLFSIEKKLESQQKKMMKLIKDLRSQKKDSQNSSKDQNIQIRTYEVSILFGYKN